MGHGPPWLMKTAHVVSASRPSQASQVNVMNAMFREHEALGAYDT